MRKRARWKWLRILGMGLIGLALIPVAEVVAVRFINPPVTPPMLLWKLGGGGTIRYEWLGLDRVPRDFLTSVVALEDARFFQHDGIDWKEVDNATKKAQKNGKAPRGASTITMQCARSLFLWQGRSYFRKGLEIYYTVLMEKLLGKRRILELYVNVIEMGDGVYGIRAAARMHFHTSPDHLEAGQCALLAALLPAPRTFNPVNPGPKLRARQKLALKRGQAVTLDAIKL